MPGQTYSLASKTYRFGFNTQEKDDEVYGEGNLNIALFWEYDTRLGRRWNVDPIDFPDISAYATFDNNPILFFDIEGLTPGKEDKNNTIKVEGASSSTNNTDKYDIPVNNNTSLPPSKDSKKENKIIKKGREMSSSFITYFSAAFLPAINSVQVMFKEGCHEGDAYDSKNNIKWLKGYKLNEKWELVQLNPNNVEDLNTVINSTVEVNTSVLVKFKTPSFVSKYINKIPVQYIKLKQAIDKAINFEYNSYLKSKLKEPVKAQLNKK